ncbi:MAG: cobyric acid synthase [Velocimicrobium sp.]
MAKSIMIQGTMSSAGKSFLVAGLCRIFKQDGYEVVPFKSQNMALNSFITEEGLEMGRAQVMQAEAAGVKPSVYMNPILLKPTNDMGSQIIVNGKVIGNMKATDYFAYKTKLIPDIMNAYHKLEEMADIIVIEGAGSPAEINLKENDIVNMGMAKMVDAPVLLVGDIDRGGVFAQLYGTVALLEEEEQKRIKGLFINKFRGDRSILDPGIVMIEKRVKIPVIGVIPYMKVNVEDEDSLTERFEKKKSALIDIAVIRFPRISNFSDFSVFEQMEEVSVRYVDSVGELKRADLIILPGSKNTIGDLKWMRQNGIEAAIKKMQVQVPIFGICGGYQMLGEVIEDPLGIEEKGSIRGMELLPIRTVMEESKTTTQISGTIEVTEGIFSVLKNQKISGYEIHMGCSKSVDTESLCSIINTKTGEAMKDGAYSNEVYGTYVHGIFDKGEIAPLIVSELAKRKGVAISTSEWMDHKTYKETQYNKMAKILRENLDMKQIYDIMGM